ncbi:hypothetical protein Franean1_3795 [Parafrankia sp. EAN1pec]|nr:hypothetical protein Franean1_3795 [Frankia sp. EAN1pec]
MAWKSHWRVGRFDVLCGGSAAAGVVLWQITSDPVLSLLFSVLADLLASIPTLMKAYDAPTSERASPYFASLVSMTVTLLTISDWKFMEYAFPLYMLLINTTVFGVVRMRSTQFGRRPYEEVVSLPRRPAAVPWQPHPVREYPLVISRPSSNLFRSGVSPAHRTSSRRSQASAADHTAARSHYIADPDGTEIELYSAVRVGRLHRAWPCRRK